MKLSYQNEYTGEVNTLQLKNDPLKYGLGYYEDSEGNTWDITSIIGANYSPKGKPCVQARQVDNSAYYSTASWGHGNGHHEWIPYYYEVIK